MFNEILGHINAMIDFEPGHCRGDVASQMEQKLQNYHDGCGQLKIVLEEYDVRMKAFNEKIDEIIKPGG